MNKIATIGLLALALQGCSDMPPSCSDSDVKDTLLSLVSSGLGPMGISKSSIKITGHETVETYEEAQEYACEARLILTVGSKSNSEIIGYSVFWSDKDKGEFYVQLEE